ncbi:hypothetical protein ACFE04_029894 [Oxalis oulophora]
MATLQLPSTFFRQGSMSCRGGAMFSLSKHNVSVLSLLNLKKSVSSKEIKVKCSLTTTNTSCRVQLMESYADPLIVLKLRAITEAISDRIEMHKNIGTQRNNWNILLLTSINSITLCAVIVTSLASACTNMNAAGPLKISSIILYLAATGMLVVMNKVQPSQLAEEQRIAVRLFKDLHSHIQAISTPTTNDVNESMDKVLALDNAYPLSILGGAMLDKFPSVVEPAVWWPQLGRRISVGRQNGKNGWSRKLEEEMRNVSKIIKHKDMADYVRLSKIALRVNKSLAIAGPLLTGLAAVGSTFVGATCSSWPVMLGVGAGVLASIVNTMEHGGQVGMVFEMYRSTAGFFKMMEENIESNIDEIDIDRRENGEILEMKLALQLGRSLPELRNLAASNCDSEGPHEFASKIL